MRLDELKADLGIYTIGVFVLLSLLGVLGISAGVGMLKGTKWGWFLGTFNHFFSIVRNASAGIYLISIYGIDSIQYSGMARRLMKHGLRVLIWSLIVPYFFRESVFDYFNLDYNKRKTYPIASGGYFFVFVLWYVYFITSDSIKALN